LFAFAAKPDEPPTIVPSRLVKPALHEVPKAGQQFENQFACLCDKTRRATNHLIDGLLGGKISCSPSFTMASSGIVRIREPDALS
jgi:hypothetical protein